MSRLRRPLEITLLLLAGAACAEHVVVPEARLAPGGPPGKLARVWLRGCTVLGTSPTDDEESVRALCVRAVERWDAASIYEVRLLDARAALRADDLLLDVTFATTRETGRTYILDLYTWGLLAPAWGDVRGTVTLELFDSRGLPVTKLRKAAEASFFGGLASWYRTDYVEEAYRETYDLLVERATTYFLIGAPRLLPGVVLASVPERAAAPTPAVPALPALPPLLAADLPAHAGLEEVVGPPEKLVGPPPELAGAEPPSSPVPSLEALAEALPILGRPPALDALRLPGSGYAPVHHELRVASPDLAPWGIVHTARREEPASLPGRLLASLGGLEASYLVGRARVASQARDELGRELDIAAGEASQRGYRVATYSAPRTTGLFVVPSLGYLDQHIDIADFRESLPQAQDAAGVEIAARCSNPDSGASLDCAAPNVYGLHMRSGFGGARGGASLVSGTRNVELFMSAELAVNVLEYRNVLARVASYSAEGSRWEVAKSGSAGGTLGLRFPEVHLGLRFAAEYQLYRDFAYAEPLEFKGFVAYNPDKNVYERARTWVEGASLGTWSVAWSAALFY